MAVDLVRCVSASRIFGGPQSLAQAASSGWGPCKEESRGVAFTESFNRMLVPTLVCGLFANYSFWEKQQQKHLKQKKNRRSLSSSRH